jgi:bifunctional non-homologous end joining protein LigD
VAPGETRRSISECATVVRKLGDSGAPCSAVRRNSKHQLRVTSFNRVRYRHHDESIFLYAFDLIELNGDDLRRDPLEGRKVTLEMILAKAGLGIRFNEHMEGDGETVFRHACKLGLEGIVSKRRDSTYRSGRSPDWLKMKNADAPAVKREAEEDWGKERGTGKRAKPHHDLRPEE